MIRHAEVTVSNRWGDLGLDGKETCIRRFPGSCLTNHNFEKYILLSILKYFLICVITEI
jgi:hypothetical protein